MKRKSEFSTVPYEVGLMKDLKDRGFAVDYLKSCIHESASDMPEVVLDALRQISEVQGMSWLSKQTGIPRQTLYHMLSKAGNPSIRAFINIIHNLGIRMTFEPDKAMVKPKRRASGGR